MKYLGKVEKQTGVYKPTLWVSQMKAKKGSKMALRDGVDWKKALLGSFHLESFSELEDNWKAFVLNQQ